ncbi:MAG: ABC transporter substrate-binding protein [Turicibacter sp.]|nr:ABC transporter substrate-binding protein [Turicibacter sp.]
MKKTAFTKLLALGAFMGSMAFLGACSDAQANDPVIIFSSADAEAIRVIEEQLDANGFAGQYLIQVLGTGELAGRLVAEGSNIEADIVTLTTFHLDSNEDLFTAFDVPAGGLMYSTNYRSPILGLEGSLMVNTEVLLDSQLPMPSSLRDLADPVFAGQISVPDLHSSATGWLLVQAIIDNYGDGEEGREILAGILANVGPHLETSGSAPVAKVRAGEVAVGFGLRQQGVAEEANGLPVQVIDVAEGNYVLTEAVALVNRGGDEREEAREMAAIIAGDTRATMLEVYPTALFEGEVSTPEAEARVRFFPETLTTDLLAQHQAFFRSAQE